MTATERAKRSDALYYETVSVTRRVLCDMIANREADLEDARAENAKLQERIATQKQTIQSYRDESREWREVADHAQAENAKLREQSERLFDKTLELATENSKLRELCKLCEREAENAKLRELIDDAHMSRLLTENENEKLRELCERCAIELYVNGNVTDAATENLFDDMRELGVEVD